MQFYEQMTAARTLDIPVFPHDNWDLEDFQVFTVAMNKGYIVQEQPYSFSLTNTYRQSFDNMKNNPPLCYDEAECTIIWMDMVMEGSYLMEYEDEGDDMDLGEDNMDVVEMIQ